MSESGCAPRILVPTDGFCLLFGAGRIQAEIERSLLLAFWRPGSPGGGCLHSTLRDLRQLTEQVEKMIAHLGGPGNSLACAPSDLTLPPEVLWRLRQAQVESAVTSVPDGGGPVEVVLPSGAFCWLSERPG